jgi:hypothetical protein
LQFIFTANPSFYLNPKFICGSSLMGRKWCRRKLGFRCQISGEIEGHGKTPQGVCEQDGFVVREGLTAYGADFSHRNRAIEQE